MIEVGSDLEISSEKYAGQVFPAALFLLFPETFELSRRSFGLLASAFWEAWFRHLAISPPHIPPPPNVSQTEQTVGWDFYVALVYVIASRKVYIL